MLALKSFGHSLKGAVRSLTLLAALIQSDGARAMDREAFIKAGLCEFMMRLWTIHQHPAAQDRFLVASVKGRAQSYVQCMLLAGDSQILCEAASGISGPQGALQLQPDQVRRLMQEGFEQGGAGGNFQRMSVAGDDLETELVSTSVLLLELLYDLYGARHPLDLEFKAPLAAELGPRPLACLIIGAAQRANAAAG